MPGYKYRGTQFDALDEPLRRTGAVLDLARCGTYSNYRQHLRVGTQTCEPCRQAKNAYEREREARNRLGIIRKPVKPVFDPNKCGSLKGYGQHRNQGVPMCDGCRQANADYCKARRNAKNLN